jgi:Protein of unknown function (DUF3455)
MRRQLHTLSMITIAGVLGACTMGKPGMQHTAFDQSTLPPTIQVPAGHAISMETVGVGTITYECKLKASTSNQFEWVFAGPEAKLLARNGTEVGKYYGPPATWESSDGSKITGAQLAVSPAKPGSIPLQLVKANPAIGDGKMKNVSYIQRVATQDGVAPQKSCDATSVGGKEVVKYKADYIFWRPV